jgi:hypothetical protein
MTTQYQLTAKDFVELLKNQKSTSSLYCQSAKELGWGLEKSMNQEGM